MAENANPGDYGTLSDLEGEDDGNQPEVNPPTVQQETVQEGEEEEAEDDEDDHEDWTYVRNPKYDHFMIRFMSFKDRTTYPKDVMFTKDQVLAIRPHHVRKWLTHLAYKTITPGANDLPIHYRAESMKKAKGAISFYLPNKQAWIDGVGGNPTIHSSISKLIQKVKKCEVRGIGAKANARRAYTVVEFKKKCELLRREIDWEKRSKYTTITLWAKHLIHRVDDTTHVPLDAPHGNTQYDFTLKTRTKWSKNVTSFTNCPDQIIFGSADWEDCLLLHLAYYLEESCSLREGNDHDNVYLFANGNEDDAPEKLKRRYLNCLDKKVWNCQEFKNLDDQVGDRDDRKTVGGHSTRKFASTFATRRGAQQSQVEYRGRWIGGRGKSVCSTRYIDVNDEYADAYVASLLCSGGAVAYEIKPGLQVSDDFLFHAVNPHTRGRFGNDVRLCRVLGLALLWGAFEPEANTCVGIGSNIVDAFCEQYPDVDTTVPRFNPVVKVHLSVINTNNGELRVLKIRPTPAATTATDAAPTNQPPAAYTAEDAMAMGAPVWQGQVNNTLANQATIHHLVMMMSNLDQQMRDNYERLSNELAEQRAYMNQQFRIINNNIRRYGGTIQSSFAVQARQQVEGPSLGTKRHMSQSNPTPTTTTTPPIDQRARLVGRPKDLIHLWFEFTEGINGNKPAKAFTIRERSNSQFGLKQKYYRRMHVWRTMGTLIDGGHTVRAAANLIHQVTGQSTVTKVIDTLIQFKKTYKDDGGIHPMLRNTPARR